MRAPCSDYEETNGLIYFARMLDKIRLHARGELPPGYFVGAADGTHLDARCVKFLNVDYDKLVERTLQGGSNQEILEWCFGHGTRRSAEQILVWNQFVAKRGWRDESTAELEETKKELGFADRAEIKTWIDLHDADEGRPLRYPNE